MSETDIQTAVDNMLVGLIKEGISEKRTGITALGKCRNRKDIPCWLYR